MTGFDLLGPDRHIRAERPAVDDVAEHRGLVDGLEFKPVPGVQLFRPGDVKGADRARPGNLLPAHRRHLVEARF